MTFPRRLDYDAIRALWDQGVRGPTAIGRQLGYNSKAVWRALRCMGIDTSGRKHIRPKPHVIKTIVQYTLDHREMIKDRLRGCNKKKSEKAWRRYAQIVNDLKDGMKPKDVAAKYGVTRFMVSEAQRRTGYMAEKRQARTKVIDLILEERAKHGTSVTALAQKYGYCESWVARVVTAEEPHKAMSTKYKRSPAFKRRPTFIEVDKLSPAVVEAIVSKYTQGDSLTLVAKQVGYYTSIVKRVLEAHGIAIRPNAMRPKCDREQILRLWREGVRGPSKIAEMTNHNTRTIYNILRDEGIPVCGRRIAFGGGYTWDLTEAKR